MRCVLEHPFLRGVRRIVLVTHDPRLYLKAGFSALKDPASYMEIVDRRAYATSTASRSGGPPPQEQP
jgi:hypothetical protein